MDILKQNEKLIEQFSSYTFEKKKSELLFMLRELYWTSEEINKLWELVYGVNDERNWHVLVKVYSLLLEALVYAKDKKSANAVQKLNVINDVLMQMKDQENNEKILEESELDSLLSKIDNI